MRARLVLRKAERRLTEHLERLEECLEKGEDGAWPEYLMVAAALGRVHKALAPEYGGPLLTTGEMAAKLGLSAKTLLRHKASGKIKPSVAQGKLLRWSGSERFL